MDEQRMEENNISLLHLQVDSVILKLLICLDAEISFVDVSVPIRILVVVESSLVGFREDV